MATLMGHKPNGQKENERITVPLAPKLKGCAMRMKMTQMKSSKGVQSQNPSPS